ncbi:ABC transporter substrate-binding protein [Roseococcus sp. DSY-14]|uniref:ABC transporter substrate-binding protein n=1 Tax=Roseococcus sp. DSY-14 TaxID=3369650 RepID=UPI00387B58E0
MAAAIIAALGGIGDSPAQSPPPTPQPPRLEAMRARGELRVCIWPDYFAVTFRNPRTNELEGMDVDMARALAQRLGLRPTFVETSFAGFMDLLEAGACDIAMMAVGITRARAQRVAFSRPYMASPVFAVTQRGNTRVRAWADIDHPGNVVAVAAGTVMEPLMNRTLRRAELMVVTPPRTREAELLAGRADVFMSDFPYTRRLVHEHDWAVVIEPPDRFGETLYGWALPLHDPAWLAEVNNFQSASRADGTLARAAARHGLTPILLR